MRSDGLAALEARRQSCDITIPALLRLRAKAHPQALAIREKEHGIWKRFTWAHYYETAKLVAFGLQSLGLKRGERIAIASENTPEWYYADLGAEMLGAPVTGIYPTNPWPELQYIVRHCGARVVFTGDLGRANRPILGDPEVTEGANVLITESTYGDLKHDDIEKSFDLFFELMGTALPFLGERDRDRARIARSLAADDIAMLFERRYRHRYGRLEKPQELHEI